MIYFIEVYVLIDEEYCIFSPENEHSPRVSNVKEKLHRMELNRKERLLETIAIGFRRTEIREREETQFLWNRRQ